MSAKHLLASSVSFGSPPLAFAALRIVDGNNAPAFRTRKCDLLLFHKCSQSFFFNISAICHQACPVPGNITLFQVLYGCAWVLGAFIAVRNGFFFGAGFDSTLAAMLWFVHITFETACARFLMAAVFVAYHTIHSTRGKHRGFNWFERHNHESASSGSLS